MRRIQEWASEREVRRGIEAVVLISLTYAMPPGYYLKYFK
jgi:hypothetical protein